MTVCTIFLYRRKDFVAELSLNYYWTITSLFWQRVRVLHWIYCKTDVQKYEGFFHLRHKRFFSPSILTIFFTFNIKPTSKMFLQGLVWDSPIIFRENTLIYICLASYMDLSVNQFRHYYLSIVVSLWTLTS